MMLFVRLWLQDSISDITIMEKRAVFNHRGLITAWKMIV